MVTFQAFWHGPDLTVFHRACMRSFTRFGHGYDLYCYEPLDVPVGVRLMDANAIIPEDELFYFDNDETGRRDLGPFSDLFRFKLLRDRGGWYVDMDTICVSGDFPEVERAWSRECPEIHPGIVGTSQIAFPRGDAVVADLYRQCLERSGTYTVREDLGPNLISAVIPASDLPLDMNGGPESFFPIRWIEMFKLMLPAYRSEVETKAEAALFLPVYQSFFQYCGLELSRMPPEGSYLQAAYAAFAPEIAEIGAPISSAEVIDRTRDYFKRHHRWAIRELEVTCGRDVVRDFSLADLLPEAAEGHGS